jgi:hypothetical protein
VKVVTWNMSHWEHRGDPTATWSYLGSLAPDVALLQEAILTEDLGANWRFCPQEPWVIDEHRRWASGIATRQWALAPVGSVITRYSSSQEFAVIPDSYYRGALAVGEVEVPDFGRVAVVSTYALMKPLYAQTTLLRMIADLIPLFDSPRYDHYLLGGDLNVHTQVSDETELRRYQAILGAVESLGLVNCFKQTSATRGPLVGCRCREEVCYHARTHLHRTQVGSSREAVGGHNDYLFASPELAERLVGLRVVGDDDPAVWKLSNHCPVIGEFNLA